MQGSEVGLAEPSQERIGAYRLLRRLGAGGMGEVFLGWDDRLHRAVALKRLRQDREASPARRERLRREARAAAGLSHAHVVQVFDLIEAGGREGSDDWIVMEHVQGRTLDDILRPGPLPPGAAVELGRQVCEALAAAHARGLVHRDLKTQNVMVTPAGQAKVLDFGLARPLQSGSGETVTDDGVLVGTYRSMSPEQARGEAADARSDLFSLGVLLYEMLGGTPPFQGKTPLETLRNVTEAPPRPLAEVRPELSPELLALVGSLLEKDPAQRPAQAEDVVRTLRSLAARPGLELPEDWLPPAAGDGDSDTYWGEPTATGEPAVSPPAPEPRSRRRSAKVAVFALLGGLALALLLVFVFRDRIPFLTRPPLRIAVLRPAVEGAAGDDSALIVAGVQEGTLRSLLSLRGLSALEPARIGAIPGGGERVAREVKADEALATTILRSGPTARVTFRRIRAVDGAVLWTEGVEVPTAPKDALVLASAVASVLRRGYGDRPPREGAPQLEAKAEDYADFLRIKRRLDAGSSASVEELEALEALAVRSPRFLDAHLLAATLALNLFVDTREARYLERARAALERGRPLAPGYPTLLAVETRLALTVGDGPAAERTLAALERAMPGDVLVPIQRSLLAEKQGRPAEAIAWMREVVRRQPTWRDLLALATLEARQGEMEEARRHLGQILRQTPGNAWARAKLGEVELLYGDLRRAEEIYAGLVREGPQRSDLTNLGLVHFLLGEHGPAVAAYRRALALQPGHLVVTLNLADAEHALGEGEAAAGHYRQVLAALREKGRSAPLEPVERTIEAQCLVRLGDGKDAVALALETVQKSPQEPEVAYQAALVLSLAGDRSAALALAKQALRLGIQPRWFTIPGFEGLRADLGL